MAYHLLKGWILLFFLLIMQSTLEGAGTGESEKAKPHPNKFQPPSQCSSLHQFFEKLKKHPSTIPHPPSPARALTTGNVVYEPAPSLRAQRPVTPTKSNGNGRASLSFKRNKGCEEGAAYHRLISSNREGMTVYCHRRLSPPALKMLAMPSPLTQFFLDLQKKSVPDVSIFPSRVHTPGKAPHNPFKDELEKLLRLEMLDYVKNSEEAWEHPFSKIKTPYSVPEGLAGCVMNGGWTFWHAAIFKDDIDGLTWLLQQSRQCLESQTWEDGLTPLMLACYLGHNDCVNILLQAGAKQHTQDMKGFAAIHHAVAQRSYDCLHLLLTPEILKQNPENINRVGWNHVTPLLVAAYIGCVKSAEILMGRGAKHDLRMSEGWGIALWQQPLIKRPS